MPVELSSIALDETSQALRRRHADWWQGNGMLVSRVQGTPLEPLWLPLADGTLAFIAILFEQLRRIPKVDGGYVNPFGTWAPGTVVRTQCDASVLLSPRHYGRWFLPFDERISTAVDYSIIHLHSCSLHVVGELLKVYRPQAIQVTIETGPNVPSVSALLPVFRRILGAKPLTLAYLAKPGTASAGVADGPLTEDELHLLQDALPSDGLCIIARQAPW